MRSYLSLIPISARVHRRQNRMTLLCIIFAVFMVTAIFSMAEMGARMEQSRLSDKHGEFSLIDSLMDTAMGQTLMVTAAGMFLLVLIAGVHPVFLYHAPEQSNKGFYIIIHILFVALFEQQNYNVPCGGALWSI